MKKQTEIYSARNTESVRTNEKKPQGTAQKRSPQREAAKESEARNRRFQSLQDILRSKRQEIVKEIQEHLGRSLAEDQQRRSESMGDAGDQAVMDHERERDIFLMEMRNRRRQSLDEAITRLHKGSYGICAECGIDINEKRLRAVPFAKLCAECLSRAELLETGELVLDRIGLGFTAIASRTSPGLNKSRAEKVPLRMV